MSSAKQSVKRALALSTGAVLSTGALCMVPQAANAVAGDSITVASVGPIRNAGSEGGVIVLKTSGVDVADLALFATTTSTTPAVVGDTLTAPAQDVKFVSADFVANGAGGDSNPTDNLDEITLRVAGTTQAAGDALNFVVVDNDGANANGVEGSEARASVSTTTAGAPATVEISPSSQTAAAGVPSGNYTVAIKDAGGRPTQLTGLETLTTTGTAVGTTLSKTFNAAALSVGSTTFTATSSTAGANAIKLNYSADTTKSGSATLNVSPNATITADELDIATGADTWNGFGGGISGGSTAVRIDQGTVTLNFQSLDKVAPAGVDDANSVVTVVATPSGGVKFAGSTAAKTYTITLDAAGKGSIAITPDAGSIVDGGGITLSGAFAQTLSFQRAAAEATGATATTDQGVYLTKIGSPTSVTVTVKDQFGNVAPAGTQVALVRSTRAANAGTTARATVDANGKATFTLPDAGTAAGSENLQVVVFTDQFDASGTNRGTARIDYTTDGLGTDFGLSVADSNTPATNPLATGYVAGDLTTVPLTDADAGAATEFITVNVGSVTAGTPGAPATVSVDNGALVLTGSDTALSKAAASKTITLDSVNGTGSVKVIGTKAGTVNVTVASGGRTKTFAVTVSAGTVARNLDVTGPAKVTAGSNQTYTVLVTDAFGNPVANTAVNLSIQYAGPVTQNGTVAGTTDAAGKIAIPVRVNTGATDPVKVTVTGSGAQFGALADHVLANDGTAATGTGLTASVATDTVTTDVVDIAALQAAVDAAQAKVDAATIAVSDATDAVTLSTLKVDIAQGKVADAKKDVAKAKKAVKKAKKQGKGVKAAKAKLAKKQRALADAKDNLKVAKAELAIANNKLTTAQATLAAAQQELADAQAALAAAQQS